MPPPEKASEESPGSKELRRIQEVRRRKRAREADEDLEDEKEEEEARKKLEKKKTLGLANPKKKIKKASGKTSKEGDPKKNPKSQQESQQEKPSPEPKKIRVDSRVDKESFKRVRDAIAKTVVTDSQVDDVPPPGAHASDGSEEGAHTSDSESVDSSLTSGSEEQTSLKKHRSSNSQVMLLKSHDLLDKTSDVSKIETFGNKVSHMNSDDGSLASNFLSENLKSQIMVTLLAYQGSQRLLASCRGISLEEESQVEERLGRFRCPLSKGAVKTSNPLAPRKATLILTLKPRLGMEKWILVTVAGDHTRVGIGNANLEIGIPPVIRMQVHPGPNHLKGKLTKREA